MRFNGFKITGITLSILVIVSTSLAFSETNNKKTHKTSFDCAKVTSDTEKIICSAPELAEADVEMASIYKGLLYSLPSTAKQQLKQEQMAWLKTRNQCSSVKNIIGCIGDAYRSRIETLKKQNMNPNAPSPLRADAEDDINGCYEKIGEYDSGELKVNKVNNHKINIKIYTSVTNSSCEFGYDYGGGAARAAFAILDNNNAKYSDDTGCELNLNFIHNQVTITTTEECNSYRAPHK